MAGGAVSDQKTGFYCSLPQTASNEGEYLNIDSDLVLVSLTFCCGIEKFQGLEYYFCRT